MKLKSSEYGLGIGSGKKKADKRLKWRLTIKVNSKQFWALVRRAERKRGSLSAIRDVNGNIITNRELVEQIVLVQLALIFSGKHSPIFSHRNEQIIKESHAKSEYNWRENFKTKYFYFRKIIEFYKIYML